MRRFLRSLHGRLILLIFAALTVAQAISLWLFFDERGLAVHAAQGLESADRAANVARLIEEAPPELHAAILRAANSPLVRFHLDAAPSVDHGDHDSGGIVEARIRRLLPADPTREVRVELHEFQAAALPTDAVPQGMAGMHRAMMHDAISATEMRLSIALTPAGWLNVDTRFHRPPLQWPWMSALSFGLTAALILAAVVWFLLRQLTGPLRRLARAADELGRGEDVGELASSGPTEVRDLTEAFNNMRDRLTRFVADRTRLLAALGHDLRSPLTGLRVRAELVEDAETRDRLIATIEEMQDMVDATLSFARGVATREPSAMLALGDFVAGICADLSEAGHQVTPQIEANPRVSARPTQLKRALRNVVENASRYGGSAEVTLTQSGGEAVVSITDSGPGIPDDMLEKVFDPFVRLESSRSRDTGGSGLGLSIARTVIQAHGGQITLANLPGGGLQARISLPIAVG